MIGKSGLVVSAVLLVVGLVASVPQAQAQSAPDVNNDGIVGSTDLFHPTSLSSIFNYRSVVKSFGQMNFSHIFPKLGIGGYPFVDSLKSHVPSLSWWHSWYGCGDQKVVPCYWYEKSFTNFTYPPVCPAYKVFFWGNEPEGADPEAAIAPQTAAAISHQIVTQLRNLCGPDIAFIVGGSIQGGTGWLDQYFAAGGEGHAVHTHCYAYINAQECVNILTSFKQKYPHFCLTEWAFLAHRPWSSPTELEQSRQMFTWVKNNVPCHSYFIDYMDQDYWGRNIDTSLYFIDGTLTPLGLIFKDVFSTLN